MKILYVVDKMVMGGIETRLISTVSRLKELGHTPIVVSMAATGPLFDKLIQTGVQVETITDRPKDIGFFKPRIIKALRAIMKKTNPDVIHLCDIISGHIGRISCLGLGKPVVYQLCSNATHNRLKYRVAGRVLSFVTDHFIAVSDEVWKVNGKYQNYALRPHSIVYNGANERAFAEAQEVRTDTFFSDSDGPFIFSCGRLVPLKNVDMLIKSFADLSQSHPTARLLIIGDGPERKKLEALVQELDLTQTVHFTGLRQDVPGILKGLAQKTSVFALPSDYEGFSIAFSEALYSGIPVAISKPAAPSAVTGDGILSFELDQHHLTKALETALSSEQGVSYDVRKKNALEIGAKLTIQNNVEQLLRLYKSL